jgi:hypothetical protein
MESMLMGAAAADGAVDDMEKEGVKIDEENRRETSIRPRARAGQARAATEKIGVSLTTFSRFTWRKDGPRLVNSFTKEYFFFP